VGIAGKGFDEIEVKVTSSEPPERIKQLASAAASDCYVTNTLKRSCKVAGRVILNGENLMDI
jgi:uncharacterized OsmC-like protein